MRRPGESETTQPTELSFIRHATADDMEPYERLLGDALAGDGTLFTREDSVDRAWEIVQPVLQTGTPLYPYEAGSWGPNEAECVTTPCGGWHTPEGLNPIG